MAVFKDKEKTKDGRQWYFKVYYTDISGNKKVYKSKKFETKKEALEEEAKFIISNDKPTSKVDFKTIYYDYINEYKKNTKISTFYTNERLINKHILPFFIDKKEITINDLRKFKDHLDKVDLNNRYKQKIFMILKSICSFGNKYYNYDIKAFNIVDNFKNNDEIKKFNFWTYEEFNNFINVIDDIKWKTFFMMLYYTGARKGELLALTWKDYASESINIDKSITTKTNGDGWKITTPKNKSSIRKVLLPKKMIEQLEIYFKEQKKYINFNDDWFIFGGIEPLSMSSIDRAKNKYVKMANVKNIRIHDFRHSHASLLINNGASVLIVSKRLGHRDIATTLNIYSHMFPDEQIKIINLIDSM